MRLSLSLLGSSSPADFLPSRSLIGFLLGVSLVGGYGYFRLLDDYKQASSALLLSVDELKRSTTQVRSSRAHFLLLD